MTKLRTLPDNHVFVYTWIGDTSMEMSKDRLVKLIHLRKKHSTQWQTSQADAELRLAYRLRGITNEEFDIWRVKERMGLNDED